MAISLVQSTRAAANAANVTATYGSATTSGNLLLAFGYTNNNAGTQSITGGAWTQLIDKAYSGTGQSIDLFYKIADGTETTVQLNGNTICRLHIAEFSGLDNPAATDGTNTNTVNTTMTINTNSITTTNTNDLLVVAGGTSAGATGTRSWDSSFNVLQDDAASPRLLSGYRIVSATGTYSSTGTLNATNTNCGAYIASFKFTSAAATPHFLSLLGVGS